MVMVWAALRVASVASAQSADRVPLVGRSDSTLDFDTYRLACQSAAVEIKPSLHSYCRVPTILQLDATPWPTALTVASLTRTTTIIGASVQRKLESQNCFLGETCHIVCCDG